MRTALIAAVAALSATAWATAPAYAQRHDNDRGAHSRERGGRGEDRGDAENRGRRGDAEDRGQRGDQGQSGEGRRRDNAPPPQVQQRPPQVQQRPPQVQQPAPQRGNDALLGGRGQNRQGWDGRGRDSDEGSAGRGNRGAGVLADRGRDGRGRGDWNGDRGGGRDNDGRGRGDGNADRGGRDNDGRGRGEWNGDRGGRDNDGRGRGDWNGDRGGRDHANNGRGGSRGGRDWDRDGRRGWRDDDNHRGEWDRGRGDSRYRPYRNTHRDFSRPRYQDWRHVRHGYYFDRGYAIIVGGYYGRDYYWWGYDGWRRPYRRWAVGYVIPSWLWWEPVPWDLFSRRPPAPYGCRYVYADGDILLVAIATGIIIDALLYY
jgi:hypothetical protein